MPATADTHRDVPPAPAPKPSPERDQLARLREMCAGLADSMDENATRLESTGVPPAEVFLDDLSQFRRQVAGLLSLVRPGESPLTALREIEERLEDGEQAERCLAAIDRFLRLKGGEGGAALQLAAEKQRAGELKKLVEAGSAPRSATQELADGRHPWCDLVLLTTEADRLDDERWNELSTSVTRHLGSAIATAAARGRIVLETPVSLDNVQSKSSAVVDIPSVPRSTGEPLAAAALDVDSCPQLAPSQPSAMSPPPPRTGADPQSTTPPLQPASTAGARQRELASSPVIGLPSPIETDRLPALAKIALGATDPARCAWISELILELVAAGRPGLAYHLARCLEGRQSRACVSVPSSLIRFWTIGQSVLFPRGELAALLQADLVDLASRIHATSDESWTEALSLLTRAAALRPAIVAPATGAASWLRSIPREGSSDDVIRREGCQLYNYFSRVSSDSEKLGGFRTGLGRRGTEGANVDTLRQDLVADIRRWQAQPPPPPLRYEATTPLFLKAHWTLRAPAPLADRLHWSEWQRAARSVDTVIGDILADRRQEAPRLKAEMDRISRELLPSLQTDVQDAGPRPQSDRGAELRERLLQTLSFGQRWLAITTMPSGGGPGFLPQAAEDLLREVRNRHVAVLKELETLQQYTTARPVRTALTILSTAIESVRRLVDSDNAGETTEPDPRHLLHAELLKIPTVRLDAAWEPELDRRRLEEEILRSLTSPDVDWEATFRMRITIDDPDSAARILSLPRWSSGDRERMQRQLDEARRLGGDDDTWIRTDGDRAVESGPSGRPTATQEHAALLTRLERLRTMLQTDLDAAADTPATTLASTPQRRIEPLASNFAADEQGSASVFD